MALTRICAVLAGRLPDDTLTAVRDFYAAGEWQVGDDTLLLNLAYREVGVTDIERELIRSFVGDPDGPDLAAVPALAVEPPVPYRFSPDGGPDPAQADRLLAAAAVGRGQRGLLRSWRKPLAGAPDDATWVYVVLGTPTADPLRLHSDLTSELFVRLEQKWALEVVVGGSPPTPYQSAALAAAHPVWTG